MDSVKIGKYIASLRRQAGLTQEMLGEKLGVAWEKLDKIDALKKAVEEVK